MQVIYSPALTYGDYPEPEVFEVIMEEHDAEHIREQVLDDPEKASLTYPMVKVWFSANDYYTASDFSEDVDVDVDVREYLTAKEISDNGIC